ncbi:MAG: lipase family protein [Candidatus Woesearchaeota archaeon]|jgi:triacylglycerol lipase|nr:lipase family protein [Candidatus Woesearchaeota archaeon]
MTNFEERIDEAIRLPYPYENKETDTQWDFYKTEDTLILRFQGSFSKKDWLQNFNAFIVPYKDMKKRFYVHAGFLKKYKSIREEVLKVCADEDIKEIEILGHSQGAGLSILAHEDIRYHFPNIEVNSYVYGCPRVVSWNAPDDRWKGFNSIRNGNDVATKVPFFWMGYKHVGKKINVGKKRIPFIFSFKAHYPNSYKIQIIIKNL